MTAALTARLTALQQENDELYDLLKRGTISALHEEVRELRGVTRRLEGALKGMRSSISVATDCFLLSDGHFSSSLVSPLLSFLSDVIRSWALGHFTDIFSIPCTPFRIALGDLRSQVCIIIFLPVDLPAYCPPSS